jgi:hypothetical protein
MKMQGIIYNVVRVDGDVNGKGLPTRIVLSREGITGEYVLKVAVDNVTDKMIGYKVEE